MRIVTTESHTKTHADVSKLIAQITITNYTLNVLRVVPVRAMSVRAVAMRIVATESRTHKHTTHVSEKGDR